MKLRTIIEQPSVTVELANGMKVTIYDSGVVTVRQESRDLLHGAPSAPDVPRYDPGGEYEFTLPEASEVAQRCDQRDADPGSPDFPATGYATISVIHRH